MPPSDRKSAPARAPVVEHGSRTSGLGLNRGGDWAGACRVAAEGRRLQRRPPVIGFRIVKAAAAPPLRILFSGSLPPHPGGSSTVHALLLPALSRAGFAVEAIATGTARETAQDRFALDHPDIAVHRIEMPYMLNNPFGRDSRNYFARQQALSMAMLERVAAARPPDLILIGREVAVPGVPAVARRLGIPTVLIAHGPLQAMLNGAADSQGCDEMLAAVAQIDVVIAVSRAMGRLLRRSGLRKVVAIPNGIDSERFTPGCGSPSLRRRLGLPRDAVICGHVSNMKPIKRPLDLAHAARRVAATDTRIHWLVVGLGEQWEPMQRAVADAGLADRFRFVAWVDRSELTDYMRLFDVLAMPSLSEGTPLVCLEAMATGCVPLLSDIPAHREVTASGRAGLLFRVGDADHLAEELLRLAADPSLRDRLGAAAIARVQEAYRWERALARYIAVLGRMARDGRRSRLRRQAAA